MFKIVSHSLGWVFVFFNAQPLTHASEVLEMQQPTSKKRVLVLGYYEHCNIGDECFRVALSNLAPSGYNFIFRSIDDPVINWDTDTLNYDAVIVAGGDLINSYFMERVKPALRRSMLPCYALSVGIPYPSTDDLSYLHLFDHVVMRDKGVAFRMANELIGSGNVSYLPDITWTLMNQPSLSAHMYRYNAGSYAPPEGSSDMYVIEESRKRVCLSQTETSVATGTDAATAIATATATARSVSIGISLAQPYFYNNKNAVEMVADLSETFLEYDSACRKRRMNAVFTFHAFNTNSGIECESDLVCTQNVIRHMQKTRPGVTCVIKEWDIKGDDSHLDASRVIQQCMDCIQRHTVMICMRYHALLFSMMTNTPFIALFTTSKIESLLDMADHATNTVQYSGNASSIINAHWYSREPLAWQYIGGIGIKLKVDDQFMPTFIPRQTLRAAINAILVITVRGKVVQPYTSLCNMASVRTEWADMIRNLLTKLKRRHVPVHHAIATTYYFCNQDHEFVKRSIALLPYGYAHGKKMANPDAVRIARNICFALTRRLNSEYEHGMQRHFMEGTFDPYEAPLWVRNDMAEKMKLLDNQKDASVCYPPVYGKYKRVIMLNHVQQDEMANVHRSGWAYAVGGLQNLDVYANSTHMDSNEFRCGGSGFYSSDHDSAVLVDTCVERTFFWAKEQYCAVHLLPYKKKWIGFIHHTFAENYSEHNLYTLFRDTCFQQSLQHCNALVVFSHWLRDAIYTYNVNGAFQSDHKPLQLPMIAVLSHPTEIVKNTFTLANFVANKDKLLVNVGAWLRNPYTIYNLQLPIPVENGEVLKIRKCSLKGNSMENYFPCEDFEEAVMGFISRETEAEGEERDPSKNRICTCKENKFHLGAFYSVHDALKSVEVIECLDNDKYDTLLSRNIVFLHFDSDPSACNTLIECIVRGTPVLVNRNTGTEEILGKNYPGFYSCLHEAGYIATNLARIHVIHDYLTNMHAENKQKYQIEHFVTSFSDVIQRSRPL